MMMEKQKRKVSYREILENKPGLIVKHLFKNDKGDPLLLTPYQERIVKAIVCKKPRRVLCWAATRAGKSMALAIGIILLACVRGGEHIRIIAPTYAHTRIIMDYVIQHFFDSPDTISFLKDAKRGDSVERLKEKLSKEHIHLKNNSDIQAVSASIATEGRTLIGLGATSLFIDEAELDSRDWTMLRLLF
jgi:phage terminase large subunit-like protein